MKRTEIQRFAAMIRFEPSGCWRWLGQISTTGYGRFRRAGRRDSYAHRTSYELLMGEIPKGLVIDHLCRNTWCVNPFHLEPVPSAVNTRRGSKCGRPLYTHCSHGHEYTPENTKRYRTRRWMMRVCLTCVREAGHRANAKRRRISAGAHEPERITA